MIYILFGLLAIALIPVIFVLYNMWFYVWPNPLSKPSEQIRTELLEITPIGASMGEAQVAIRDNSDGWWIVNVNRRFGVDMSRHGGQVGETTGESSIRVNLGGYGFFIFWATVEAEWAFNENGELIDIFVVKLPSFNNPNNWGNRQ